MVELEGKKARLREDVDKLQQVKTDREASLKSLEDAKAKVMEEIGKLKGEAESLLKGIVGGCRGEVCQNPPRN